MHFAKAILTSNYLVWREADSSAQLLNFPGHPPVSYLLYSFSLSLSLSLSRMLQKKYIDFIVTVRHYITV